MNKLDLRKQFIEKRRLISDKDKKSHLIFKNVTSIPNLQAAKTVAVYNSLADEVGTAELIEYLLECGKYVFLPKVFGDVMEFYHINSLSDVTVRGCFGILEPQSDDKSVLDKSTLDIVILPGVCFDKLGNRIGFGKGYYDRYLQGADDVLKIAVCFEDQIIDYGLITFDEHDVKADIIVTEKGIYVIDTTDSSQKNRKNFH